MRRTAALAVLLSLAGCGGGGGLTPAGEAEVAADPTGGDEGLTGTLTVFAAASLTDVFTGLGERLEVEHPQLDVRFNFAGSSALAQQIAQGAPADVFASAAEGPMATVTDAGLAEDAEVFARNPLVLAVPVDNPAGIEPPATAGLPGLADLLVPEHTVAVCAPEVPCGAAAAEVLGSAGLADAPDTYDDDVRAVLTKVELGEVDAGLVYVSDVRAAGDAVLAYAFRESARAVNAYPVAVLADAPNAEAGRAFVDLVLSEEGRRALTDAGFQQP
ncbi:molybdate ABC transporter substrate-binding protein [Geodermatophilus sp. YIM 151500]|uniref:molybdate ABC transporter substrate-binding protein n=1 Tax=Geodermatophilus sp. YIM 151500 TaxID=2984531 RepID=UPI0021E47C85|nr:molybdate ABC transporter substrate-binding protein [Geodermatophilus sp. YIM 151500]MCV2490081.1 molybdate ABC transporter substrate-binding protein [Geodermatophilus sp. YIM 151500]